MCEFIKYIKLFRVMAQVGVMLAWMLRLVLAEKKDAPRTMLHQTKPSLISSPLLWGERLRPVITCQRPGFTVLSKFGADLEFHPSYVYHRARSPLTRLPGGSPAFFLLIIQRIGHSARLSPRGPSTTCDGEIAKY